MVIFVTACSGSATPTPLPPDTPVPTEAPVSRAQPQELMPTRNHVPLGDVVSYSTVPPTSGDHWPRWAQCGIYLEGLPDELIVHNLEHSNIVVSYNLTTEEEVAQLLSVINGINLSRDWGVVRFYDRLEPGTVALASWGVLQVMNGVDRGRITAFFQEFHGELGPERIPC
ncbi:MAG: DUF3105 domain-containing protein [Dehalococcoidia bacterium]